MTKRKDVSLAVLTGGQGGKRSPGERKEETYG